MSLPCSFLFDFEFRYIERNKDKASRKIVYLLQTVDKTSLKKGLSENCPNIYGILIYWNIHMY